MSKSIKKIITFYKSEEKLPEKSGYYLCYTDSGAFHELHYSTVHKAFNAFDEQDSSVVDKYKFRNILLWTKINMNLLEN